MLLLSHITSSKACISIAASAVLLGSVESFLFQCPVSRDTPALSRGTSTAGAISPSTSTSTTGSHHAIATSTEPTISKQRIPGEKLLSSGLDNIAEVLGGSGRAKMVWSALAEGVDPFSVEATADYLTPKTAELLTAAVEGLPWKVSHEHVGIDIDMTLESHFYKNPNCTGIPE